MIEALDTTLRIATAGAATLLLLLLVAGRARAGIKISLAGLLLGAVAYLFNSSPLIARGQTGLESAVDLFSLFTPFWIWMFARTLFERTPPRWAILGSAAILILSWFSGNFISADTPVGRWIGHPMGFYVIHVLSLVLIADLVRIGLADRADDLIEKRRLIRLWLPLLVAAQAGGILTFELIVGEAIPYPPVQLANAGLIFALTLFAGHALLDTDPVLMVETVEDRPVEASGETLSPSEMVLKEKLEAAMAGGHYRTPGLTIAGLAEHLDTPEHRLRSLINQRLGYRNFSAFLNRHRIAEACELLADREKVDLPVLTIAMDLGYNSLPTFNRAFRSETGTTPSDFRREAIGQN
ncbi:AraC family transcriptional regulator [Qipengyuania flava]|uniref:AraC family transcriptional regulator n=1 Tax=Qipengyuania flava TaxID=192812 RepID=UPI001C636B86|nr:helix-turn-helix domain-containing protein [Qipengyuania flava]QYJ08252.1 helix-turn-helix domain-containing protein [Qipengyuania flava]